MKSAFSNTSRKALASSTPNIDEQYDLKGLNLIAPDQVMPKGETPHLLNSRMYPREDEESRVAVRTRKGSMRYSTPVGETLNTQNVATGTGDVEVTPAISNAQPFVPSSTNALTKLELEIKKAAGTVGHLIVEVYDNNGGVPGVLLAQGSVINSSVTDTYAYYPVYFIDAPSLTNGSTYFIFTYIQEGGSGTYYLRKTAASGALTSSNMGGSWTSLGYSFRYKTYLSTVGPVLGYMRRYPVNGANRTLFAHKNDVYATPTTPAVPVSISSAISSSASVVRFCQFNDYTIWCDGFNTNKKWDGTTVSTLANSGTSRLMIPWKQRIFKVPNTDPTRVDFSALNDFETYRNVDFFYVPSPKSPDHISGWRVFQDNLVIFTHETKHIITGSDISSFQRTEAVGTKGAVGEEAIAVDRNFIYFMADDGLIYRFNGVSDENISEKIEPLLRGIQDKSAVRLHIYNNQLRVYYAKAPSTVPDRMALLDLNFMQWFNDDGRPLVGSIEFTNDDNELIEFSCKVGAFYTGETGYNDLGKMIDWQYYTRYNAYSSGASKDRLKRFRPQLRTLGYNFTMQIGKDIDFQDVPDMRDYLVDGGGVKWGSGWKWGDGTKYGSTKYVNKAAPMSGRGLHTQYRFKKKGVDTPVELYGYVALYKSGRPR